MAGRREGPDLARVGVGTAVGLLWTLAPLRSPGVLSSSADPSSLIYSIYMCGSGPSVDRWQRASLPGDLSFLSQEGRQFPSGQGLPHLPPVPTLTSTSVGL